jgi:hypothetical protein
MAQPDLALVTMELFMWQITTTTESNRGNLDPMLELRSLQGNGHGDWQQTVLAPFILLQGRIIMLCNGAKGPIPAELLLDTTA